MTGTSCLAMPTFHLPTRRAGSHPFTPTGPETPTLRLEEEPHPPDAPLGEWRDATSTKAVTWSCRRGAGTAEGQKEGRSGFRASLRGQ